MTYDYRGATPEDWYQFDFVLGLGENLLPCVPAGPDVRVVAGSALEGKVGKIPSQFNSAGLAHGLKEWQKRPILSNEIKLWSADRRLNICVRTGPISGVYAFDVDIDTADADSVFNLLERSGLFGSMFFRARENSRKFLLPFTMEEPCVKRKIKFDKTPRGPAIELLADGQQFVAAGSHSSGARYQWLPELPTHLPVLTLAQVNQIWQRLTLAYATESMAGTTITTPSEFRPGTGSHSAVTTTESTLIAMDDSTWDQLISALRFLMPHAGDNDTWSQIGYALISIQNTRPAEQLWYDFSRQAAGYEPGAPESWWATHRAQPVRSDYRHIFTLARAKGWSRTSDPSVFEPVLGRASDGEPRHAPDGAAAEGRGDDGEHAGSVLDVTPPPFTGKPLVNLVDKDFSQIIDQLETIASDEMYTQGPRLVTLSRGYETEAELQPRTDAETGKVTRVSVSEDIERDMDARIIVPVTKAYARKRLGELATFRRWSTKKDDWNETAPSAEHINNMIELGTWTKLRPLDAIARAPFVRRDGSICDVAGYDPASRAFLIFSTEFPAIPGNPRHADALSALERLRRVFHQFPWATPAAESGFLAHVLSEAGRLGFNKCPMFFYNAPTAGTGKTLLQKAASIIAHGTVPALRPWVGDGDEVRKTVYASLLAGDRSLLFDNVPDGVKIRSAELCAAITAEKWQDRKLGESESRGVPNRAVFSASGNNVTPSGDLSRRSIVIRLDANTERLAQRRFDIEDLESYLVRNRPGLLVDALTIMRAYHQVPFPDMTMPSLLGSFEQWSRFVREPLIWLGMPDPVETQKRDANEDADNLATVFEMLRARFGENEFASVDIARVAGGISDQNGALTNALITCGCKEPNSPHELGYWLRRNRDKVFGGMKLVAGAHAAVGTKWHFVKVE